MQPTSRPRAGAVCHPPSVCTSGVTAVPDMLPVWTRCMQIREVSARGLLRSPPCQSVDAGRGDLRSSAKNASPSKSTLTWCRSAVNFSFFLCLAACRMRSSACDTLSRPCVRYVLCQLRIPLGPAPSLHRAPQPVARLCSLGFSATMARSDFSRRAHHRLRLLAFPMRTTSHELAGGRPWRSPGSRAKSFRTCQVLRPRRAGRALAMTCPSILPSADAKSVSARD